MWPFGSGSQDAQPPDRPAGATFREQAVDMAESRNSMISSDSNSARQHVDSSNERLGFPFFMRGQMLLGAAGLAGFGLGAAKGGPIAADRYRAENAHRQPKTKSGWYLYYRSKNYHSTVGSVTEGLKFAPVLMGWTALFAGTEEIIDRSRARLFARTDDDEDRVTGQRDAASTVMAALTVAGVYSWKQGFDHLAAGRMAKIALKYSLLFGLAQDVLASLRGCRPAYIDWVMRKSTQPSRALEAS